MERSSGRSDGNWTVDRRIPIALILTLVVNMMLGSAFAGVALFRIDAHDKEIAETKAEVRRLHNEGSRVIKLETQMTTLIEEVRELKVLLRQAKQ